jgi:hypothetical protein
MVQIWEWLFNKVHSSSNKQPEVNDAKNLFLWLLRTHLFEQCPSSSHDANEVAIKILADELVRLKNQEIQLKVEAKKIPARGLVGAFLFTCHASG